MTDKTESTADKLVSGYKSILNNTRHILEEAADIAKPRIQYALDYASDKTSELGEITKEEAERVSKYLLNDVHEAAKYISEGEREIADLARLDLLFLEDQLWDAFSNMVDQTQLELEHIRQDAQRFGEWHTGEITSMGSLKCRECGQLVHFNATSHIPPCPKCHGTHFVRDEGE